MTGPFEVSHPPWPHAFGYRVETQDRVKEPVESSGAVQAYGDREGKVAFIIATFFTPGYRKSL
jgi:hypothetical protein